MASDKKNIADLWQSMKTNRDKYKPVWDKIAKQTGITVNPDYMWAQQNDTKGGQQIDESIDDPTAALCTIQFGDYLIGIIWGTGEGVVDIVPSRWVLELADKSELDPWYDFATDQNLYHMNHSEGGLHTALKPYAYDQGSFGNSGIGAFQNKAFLSGVEDNAIQFRQFGIDNTAVDEGKSGLCEYVGTVYRWRLNRIIGEFCYENGVFSAKLFAKLPQKIREAYEAKNFNEEFDLLNLIFPREDFNPKMKGVRGTRYRGTWSLESDDNKKPFFEEGFNERPIAFCRQIKVRGQIYGRGSGTMLSSTISSVNFMVGTTIEIIEKMASPPLGIFSNALFGDSVLDTSPNALTVFNQGLASGSQSPLFPLQDVGDPSGIVEFLVPYLNGKITTAFHIDALLDFSTAKEMTATESMQRYVIRGKSLSGMLTQQKIELLEPLVKRCISILWNVGELGVDAQAYPERAQKLTQAGRTQRIIPPAVIECVRQGKPWFELKFNNELEKLTRTESVQALIQVLQAISGIAAIYPDIIEAVDWHKLLSDINDNLDYNNQIVMGAKQFKEKIAAIAKARQQAIMLQAAQAGAQVQKDTSTAQKNLSEAQNVRQS